MNIDDEKFNLLHEMAEITGSGYDVANVFPQLRDLVEQLLDCDTFIIFTNDQEQHVLSAANPYNNISSQFNNLTIPYGDSLVVDLLINRKHKTRLAPENPLLPSSRSELFAPILSPKNILGCLYLARQEENAFSPSEVKLLDLALGYIGMAIERAFWEKQQYDILSVKQRNKTITKSFLESLQQPAIIIDTLRDQVYEVNNAFAELLNFGKAELLKAPFTTICRDHLSVKNLSPDNKQNLITHWSTRENTILNLKTVYTFLENIDKGLILLIFQQENNAGNKDFWLHEMFAALSQSQFRNIQNDYGPTAGIVMNLFNADALSIHSITQPNQTTLLAAYRQQDNQIDSAGPELIKLLDPGITLSLVNNKQPVYIPEIATSEYQDKLAALIKDGYPSMVSIPLEVNDIYMGRFNLYFKNPVTLNNKDKIKLGSICQLSGNFIFTPHLKSELDTLLNRQGLLEKMIRQLFAVDRPLPESLLHTARELASMVRFDYFSLTLFDEFGNIDQSIDITWPALLDKFEPPLSHATPQDDAPLRVYQTLKTNTSSKSMQPLRLPFSMQTHTSVVLVSGERYLGNFALGRFDDVSFSRSEIDLLKLTSVILSSVVSLHYQSDKTGLGQILDDFTTGIDTTGLGGMEKHEIMGMVCQTIKETLHSQHCSFVLVRENSRLLDLFDWVPKPLLAQLDPSKIKTMLADLKKNRKPLLISDADTFRQALCAESAQPVKKSVILKPFSISSVMLNGQITALILLVLDDGQKQYTQQINSFELLSRQAEQILSTWQQLLDLNIKNQSLQDYAHHVAHELKSPLQTIKNYTSIIREDLESTAAPETRQYLTRLLLNLDNMEQMITDMLTLAGMDRAALPIEELDTRQVVNDAVTTLQGMIQSRSAQIIINNNLPVMNGNPTGIEHIFTNLISNAIKYTRETVKPIITISGQKQKNSVQFTVTDNGIGISAKDKDKIFEPFFKRNEKMKFKSNGLGLAIVKKIIDLHNGTIKVESGPGEGSKFIINFPV